MLCEAIQPIFELAFSDNLCARLDILLHRETSKHISLARVTSALNLAQGIFSWPSLGKAEQQSIP
jgi:hypothetical protein